MSYSTEFELMRLKAEHATLYEECGWNGCEIEMMRKYGDKDKNFRENIRRGNPKFAELKTQINILQLKLLKEQEKQRAELKEELRAELRAELKAELLAEQAAQEIKVEPQYLTIGELLMNQ